MSQDVWKPELYARFRAERSRPFYDLLAMVRPRPGMRVVDLGCGTGELTADAHKRLGGAVHPGGRLLPRHAGEGGPAGRRRALLRPRRHRDVRGSGREPVSTSSSPMPRSTGFPITPRCSPGWSGLLAPGGQLAVQVPANQTHASHRLANELAREEPFATALKGYVRHRSVLTPVEYALQLKRLGLVDEESRLQVYVHELSEPADIVEWCRGTLLTDYEKRLPPDLWHRYLETYRRRIVAAIPDERPYLYTYQRILFSGRRPG